jgi:FMN phosphatase YigB (HAD superfamily)
MLVSNYWQHYFQALVISSECHFRKPSRQFFRELLKVSGVTCTTEILVIGDSLVNDVYGATGLGLQAVLIDRNDDGGERKFEETVPFVQSLDQLAQCVTSKQLVAK